MSESQGLQLAHFDRERPPDPDGRLVNGKAGGAPIPSQWLQRVLRLPGVWRWGVSDLGFRVVSFRVSGFLS